jgi:hypothetical protein
MRKTAAALAVATLGLAAAGGPAHADVAAPVPPIVCGAAGPPVCDVLEDLEAMLAPIQPVLDLAGPLLGDLGADVQALSSLSQAQGLSPAAALGSATALQDALDALPKPARDLLGATVLQPLDAALDQLTAALAPLLEPVVGAPAAREGSKPTVMPSSPTTTTTPPARTAVPQDLGGAPLTTAGSTTSDLPEVPNGDVLDLGPLAVPEFELDAGSLGAADALAAPVTREQAVLATAVESSDPIGANGTSTGLVVVTFSLLLAAGAAVAQWWQARRNAHVIPD